MFCRKKKISIWSLDSDSSFMCVYFCAWYSTPPSCLSFPHDEIYHLTKTKSIQNFHIWFAMKTGWLIASQQFSTYVIHPIIYIKFYFGCFSHIQYFLRRTLHNNEHFFTSHINEQCINSTEFVEFRQLFGTSICMWSQLIMRRKIEKTRNKYSRRRVHVNVIV